GGSKPLRIDTGMNHTNPVYRHADRLELPPGVVAVGNEACRSPMDPRQQERELAGIARVRELLTVRPAHIGRAAVHTPAHERRKPLRQRATAMDDRLTSPCQLRDIPGDLPMAMQAARMEHAPMRLAAGPPDDADPTLVCVAAPLLATSQHGDVHPGQP